MNVFTVFKWKWQKEHDGDGCVIISWFVFVFVYLQKPDVQVKKFQQTVTKKFVI